MASSRNESQITWSSAAYVTVSSATIVWSDAFTFNAEDWAAELQVNADNANGSPAVADACAVYIAYTTGDVLGNTGSDYDSVEHSEFLMYLNTYLTSTPGEDPARKSAPVRTAALGFKVGVSCPNAATNNITVRARVCTHRPA